MPTNISPDTLSPENEAFVAQEIESGAYQSQRDVVNAAIDLLRQRRILLTEIEEGRRQLNEGEYTEYDQDGMRQRFQEIQDRVARQASETGQEV